ncbi:hypothetical protein SADUNF_Sadunf17G0100100 [Salix dunnii]|uniref:Uncharacterized protein n=1 Tax=Salix dunnii TaxID=1413687 RepID=A0A835J8V3_9ROSI|nr:hypothetical protein SADUNF_Sadunf17G0100100 [Salix dunnii]
MKLSATSCVNSFVFDAKGITVEFIVVKSSQDGSPVKSWQSFQHRGSARDLVARSECREDGSAEWAETEFADPAAAESADPTTEAAVPAAPES